jgi:hypothetical protein
MIKIPLRAIFPLILLGLALAGAAAPRSTPTASARPASAPLTQTDCTGGCKIHLPVISVPPIAPIALEPTYLEQVDSIAPTLMWSPTVTGTKYLIQLATTPDFVAGTLEISTTDSFKDPPLTPQSYVPRNNLDGLTTYYWRVGVFMEDGSIHYSLTVPFTTAAEDPARLAPTPQLLDPPNNARVATLTPTMTWAPVSGAVIYRVRLYDPNGDDLLTGSLVDAPATSYTARPLLPKVVYYWRVRVYNGYGWNDYGPTPGPRFRTP